MLQISLKFGIYDLESSPDEITELLGIEPSETFIKGCGYGKHERIAKENAWLIETIAEGDQIEDEKLAKLLHYVIPAIKKLRQAMPSHSTQLGIVINTDEANPGLHINKENMHLLNSVSATLDIDIYALGES